MKAQLESEDKMTKDEIRNHATNVLGYSERMTQDILDAYDLGAQAEREACLAAVEGVMVTDHALNTWKRCVDAIKKRSNAGGNQPQPED